jgi:hypothetical protein
MARWTLEFSAEVLELRDARNHTVSAIPLSMLGRSLAQMLLHLDDGDTIKVVRAL